MTLLYITMTSLYNYIFMHISFFKQNVKSLLKASSSKKPMILLKPSYEKFYSN